MSGKPTEIELPIIVCGERIDAEGREQIEIVNESDVRIRLPKLTRTDVDRIVETAVRERARVIVLNSPNNPTGSVLPEGAVERILGETAALVVCDEAYQDFGGPTALPLLRRSSRVVVLRTFSKAMGLAGLRFGLALAHPDVARELGKGKLPYNVNLITLAAAE